MELVPLGPAFAAELRGLTLAEIAENDAAYKNVRAAKTLSRPVTKSHAPRLLMPLQ